jgi:MHS family proline/betaine transporter-like MFS transporter
MALHVGPESIRGLVQREDLGNLHALELTGGDMAIAYYLVAVAAVAAVAIWFLPESARRHLPGSMPSVDSEEAARELVETQDQNPLLDLDSLPFESSFEIARAKHKGRPGKPTVM